MIEKIENESQLDGWEKRDIFTVRILALLDSYGCKYGFANYYRQVIDGRICAVMSRLDNDYTLSLAEGADIQELVRFFCISGYSSILAPEEFEFGAKYTCGDVMLCDKKLEYDLQGGIVDEYPKLMDLYNFVDYSDTDFKAWYVDISHRVRHNTAKAYTLNYGGNIVSSGILSAIIDGYSVLTAVQTDDEYRGKGFGSALVKFICNDVGSRVYIMREENLNENFYLKCGFENCSRWRMYR